MNSKKSITTFCIFSILFLFTQCEKEEVILNEADQTTFAENTQDPHAKKGGNPGKPDNPDEGNSSVEYAVISGDVSGEGLVSTSVRDEMEGFILTLSGRYGVDAGTFEGAIRILYSTKKHGENRIDFWYTDDGVDKYLMIRQPNPNNAYDPGTRTMTLVDAESLVAIRDGTGENYTDYTPSSAQVEFSDE